MKNKPLYKVVSGAHLVLEGRRWAVLNKDPEGYAVEGLDDGECTTLTFQRVDDAVRARNCEIISPAKMESEKRLSDFTGGFTRIEQLPMQERADVAKRVFLVKAIRELESEGYKITQRLLDRPDIRKLIKTKAEEIGNKKGLFTLIANGKTVECLQILSGRTLQKYLNLYQKYDENPVALMHREHLKGPQGEARNKLDIFQERFISYAITHWLDARKVQMTELVKLLKTQFSPGLEAIAQGFCFPSMTTIRKRLKAVSATVKTLGREGMRQGPNLKGAGSTDIRAVEFGGRTESDQAYMSIFTDQSGQALVKFVSKAQAAKKGDELEPNEIQRSWFHLCCDVASGMPLAWVLSETADADHSMALFRMATRDKTREKIRYGCKRDPAPPVGLMISVADNGTAIRNGQVRAALLGTATTVIDGRTYHATDKPQVESKFGTTQFQVLNFLPGYAGSRPGELPGYDPKGNATLTRDQLYGILTRYLIDEYPFAPSRGTGKFGATPMQKMEEAIETYGSIDAPSQEDRRLHLGVRANVSVTSEGVRPFNIPYNSSELQRFVDKRSEKVVTVHIDPDDLREATITFEGSSEKLHARLSMTAFNALTLNEAIDVMKEAVQGNPEKRQLHENHLWEAKKRPATESGFLKSPLDPDSYLGVEKLQQKADQLLGVEFVASGPVAPTVPPSGIMDRTRHHPAIYKIKGPPSGAEPSKSAAVDFTPITKSKL